MAKRRRKKWEVQLESLDAVAASDAASAEELRAAVSEALASSFGLVVSRAAELVRRRGLTELAGALVEAFDRLRQDAVKRDPGCLGKQAALDALDALELHDPDPFLEGFRYVQIEPAYPRSVDTAGGVRSRSGAALARMGHPQTLLVLATLLADPESPVRRTAAEAIAYHGDTHGAALLVHKCAVGDEDPIVVAEAMTALLDLDEGWAIPLLRDRLIRGGDPDDQDLVRIVLGQHRSTAAVELLISWFGDSVLAADKARAIDAIGLHRSDAARAFLLERVADGSPPVARAAIEALAIHRYDDKLRERVEAAARENPSADVVEAVAKAWSAGPPRGGGG